MDDPESVPYKHVFDNCKDFIEHYRNTYCDFVYDAKSGKFYTDFTTYHVEFIAALYKANSGVSTGTRYDLQDAFVMQGQGLFKSRAGHKVLASDKFELPEDLWFIKRDLEYV